MVQQLSSEVRISTPVKIRPNHYESGYKSIKRFMAATTSKHFGLRFFYFAFACLLYSIWRAVDLLVQVQLTGEYEHSPIVTADNTLTLVKKETGIG